MRSKRITIECVYDVPTRYRGRYRLCPRIFRGLSGKAELIEEFPGRKSHLKSGILSPASETTTYGFSHQYPNLRRPGPTKIPDFLVFRAIQAQTRRLLDGWHGL
jgi:hypothetical protein